MIYKVGKVDDRVPFLQLARSMSKKPNEDVTEIWMDKDGFTGIRLAQDYTEK